MIGDPDIWPEFAARIAWWMKPWRMKIKPSVGPWKTIYDSKIIYDIKDLQAE